MLHKICIYYNNLLLAAGFTPSSWMNDVSNPNWRQIFPYQYIHVYSILIVDIDIVFTIWHKKRSYDLQYIFKCYNWYILLPCLCPYIHRKSSFIFFYVILYHQQIKIVALEQKGSFLKKKKALVWSLQWSVEHSFHPLPTKNKNYI